MHASSIENLHRVYRRHIQGTDLEARGGEVVDIGGADVNGSFRSVFPKQFAFVAADVDPHPSVDVVLTDPYHLPFEDGRFDVVLSGQAFEHIEYFWETFHEMVRVMKPDGLMVVIAPSAGPEHRYPKDCYRFYPDAYAALAKRSGCDLVDLHWDERGPWRDLVGVFRHKGSAGPLRRPHQEESPAAPAWTVVATAEEEKTAGKRDYLEVMDRLHALLAPRTYLEIGVRAGRSLRLSRCPAIGVDPNPIIDEPLPSHIEVARIASDDFFETRPPESKIDFAFIDGLHIFEQALRDFMHVERYSRPGAVVVIDDVFPNHPKQALRKRETRVWTGDVWKLREVLSLHRPDLSLCSVDTAPSGLLIVSGLHPANRVLWNAYNPIVREWAPERAPPAKVLSREGASDPSDEMLEQTIRALRTRPTASPAKKSAPVAGLPKADLPLSVILIAFNMRRELPRTIRSLSAAMQRGISANEYEIIVVDNGSTDPFDEDEIRRVANNVTVHYVRDGGVSPAKAINHGLRAARGRLVGVCIDGARMASPGLLSAALAASRLHSRPIIGTVAFHLGPKVQMESVREGYDQEVEDKLLAESGWEEDGYRLFDISVFAGSSKNGWFTTPAESNAIFLRAEHWKEFGGYDEGFVTPGGGFVNLDVWKRLCEDKNGELILLLGEATFHQVHGGVATNSLISKQELFHDEYRRLRGQAFKAPKATPRLYGTLHAHALESAKSSLAY